MRWWPSFRREHRFQYRYSEPPNKSLALEPRTAFRCGDALVVFTDDDVQVPRGTLAAYADAAVGKPGGEFYGGPIIPDYEDAPPPEWLASLLPRSAAGWQMAQLRKLEISTGRVHRAEFRRLRRRRAARRRI